MASSPPVRSKSLFLPVFVLALALLVLAACTPTPTPAPVTPPSPNQKSLPTVSPTPPPTSTNTATATQTQPPTRTATETPTPNTQGIIQGVVYASVMDNKTPAPGSELRLAENPQFLATAGPAGDFKIDGLAPSLYHLIASNILGYSTEKIIAVTAGSVANVEVLINIPVAPLILPITVGVNCEGKPAAGAKVWVAGTNQVFTTDSNGQVTVPIPAEQARLIVSGDQCGGILQPQSGQNWKFNLNRAILQPSLPLNRKILSPGPNNQPFEQLALPTGFLGNFLSTPTPTP